MDRAIALGFFDGVHAGHAAVIKNTLKARQGTALPPRWSLPTAPGPT